MSKEEIEVPIDSLKLAKWDCRRLPDTEDEFEALKLHIETNGLIYPLTVVRMKNKEMIVIAGRRRLKVLKELGWKNIPVRIQGEDVTETELRKITLGENVHRKGIGDDEKGFGILANFEPEGYTPQQVIDGVKSIDNWFAHNKGESWKDLIEELSSSITKRGPEANPLRYDKKFVEITKSIGLSPKYQYQLLQIVIQLHPEILRTAQDQGLNRTKKLLLTHSKLRDHPKIQQQIIPKIKGKSDDQAKIIVRQYITDLETGHLTKDGTSYSYSGKARDPADVVQSNPSTEKTETHYLKLMSACDKLTFLLTGRAITKGEYKYTKEIVEKNKEHRYKIAKSFDGDMRQMNSLHDSVELVLAATKDMLEILDAEMDVAVQKKEMGGR